MTQPTSLLTPDQVVERLMAKGIEVTPESVRHWARTKRLRHVRMPGGKYYFRPEDIDAMTEPVGGAA